MKPHQSGNRKLDLTAQRERLRELGGTEKLIYLDHGLTVTHPGLDQALAGVRDGNTLVVPKLDRLARLVPDARGIDDSPARRGVQPDRSDVAGTTAFRLSQPRNGSGVAGGGSVTKLRWGSSTSSG